MTQLTRTASRIGRRIALLAAALLLAASGSAAAHGGGGYGGGMMGGSYGSGMMGAGSGGLFGGGMGLWPLLWLGLLAVLVYLVYTFASRGSADQGAQPLAVLRERYARGELSDEEFKRRQARLERSC